MAHNDRKWLIFPTLPLLDAPTRGNLLEVLDKTYPANTRGMGLPYGQKFHNPNINRFSIIHPCDGQTDGRTGDSI